MIMRETSNYKKPIVDTLEPGHYNQGYNYNEGRRNLGLGKRK